MKIKVLLWLAYRMPKELVYWCGIRLIENATTGKYSGQIVPELRAMEMMDRWNHR